jgi:hypothetical protein
MKEAHDTRAAHALWVLQGTIVPYSIGILRDPRDPDQLGREARTTSSSTVENAHPLGFRVTRAYSSSKSLCRSTVTLRYWTAFHTVGSLACVERYSVDKWKWQAVWRLRVVLLFSHVSTKVLYLMQNEGKLCPGFASDTKN